MKKLFLALVVVLFAVTAVAQTGASCYDPIPVDENYQVTINASSYPYTVWYTASTYDLPLTVHFIPDADNSAWGPDVDVDFTCERGVYEDKKLDSLINLVDDYNVTFPLTLACDIVNKDGKIEWDLSVPKSYREQLAEFGIPYNVKAYIKVTYWEDGVATLNPDLLFKNCMENSEYLHLGDTIDVVANDEERVFVLPYSDWQEDSIRFVWIGEQSATVYAAVQECGFEPVEDNPFVWTSYVVSENVPHKMYSSEMKAAIKEQIGGGLFYGKIIAPTSGRLVVERIPMSAPQDGAIMLEYGKPVYLEANDTNKLFCFPRTWTTAQFVSVTDFGVTMYVSNKSDFEVIDSDPNLLGCFVAEISDAERAICLSTIEMSDLKTKLTDDYLYVRFRCASDITITPNAWTPSSCASKSYLIRPNETVSVSKNSTSTIYRLRYTDFAGFDLTISNSSRYSAVQVYIADACEYSLSPDNSHVLEYAEIKGRKSYSIAADVVDSWAEVADEDGYLYVRFSSSSNLSVVFNTAKPIPVDPEIIISPCVKVSKALFVGDQITLNLNSAFTIYRINYAEWVKQDVTFQWSGEEALHTFIAETCEFAVAPYNRYVLNYIPVSANGNFVLDAATLATFADKVDEAGYLYIRFLTEKEGILSVSSY